MEPIGDVGQRTGTRREGACQGYFTLGGGAASLGSTPGPYPRKWGGEKPKKKKQRQESPILRQRLNQAAMATTRSVVVPNACLLLQPTAHAPSSRAGRRRFAR